MNKTIAYTGMIIFLILFVVILWKLTEPSNNNYNDWMCAHYGKDIDCITPISKDEQLYRMKLYTEGKYIRDYINK